MKTLAVRRNLGQAKNAIEGYLKAGKLHVREKFSPVRSEHVVQQSASNRVILSLDDDCFACVKEVKDGDKWVPSEAYSVSGTRNEVEHSYFEAIKNLFPHKD